MVIQTEEWRDGKRWCGVAPSTRSCGIIALFWILILGKCLLAEWAIRYYEMPFSSLFI